MDKKEFEKELNKILKQEFKNLSVENFKTKVVLKRVEFLNESNKAYITYSYKSPKFTGIGALTALSLSVAILDSDIGKILKGFNLDYNIPPYIGYPMTIAGYTFPKTDYYPEDKTFNIYLGKKERWKDLIFYVKEDILPRIDNYLNFKLEAIDDIFSKQDYYKYPLTTIMIILCLNGKQSEIDKYIDLAKSKKLYDAKNSLIPEIKQKVNEYFSK